MSIIGINNNLLALNTANNLNDHYSSLAVSTQRLSSGLRINSAADDAAGLAIRELQRADIAALRQGARNVNDAISMIQTFDGALGVIDEKLIRMKELAEQAATGTYDSTQRLMIDSEFQAMGSEINRIARATDFNGIKALDGIYSPTKIIQVQVGTRVEHSATANSVAVENPATDSTTGASVVIGSANLTASKYNRDLPTTPDGAVEEDRAVTLTVADVKTQETKTETKGGANFDYDLMTTVGGPVDDFFFEYSGNDQGGSWTLKDAAGNELKSITTNSDTIATSHAGVVYILSGVSYNGQPVNDLSNLYGYDHTTKLVVSEAGTSYERMRDLVPPQVTMDSTMGTASYVSYTDGNGDSKGRITANLGNGDRVVLDYTPDGSGYITNGEKITFSLDIKGTASTKTTPIYENRIVPVDNEDGIPDTLIRIHFGPGNDQKEDYYDVNKYDATLKGLGLEGVDIQTQDKAQKALVQIEDAIIAKDKIRTDYGAMQNRFENTLTNIQTQAENLQAAESRISDADIAQEMMNFVRNQILTQSAVAMLSQANSLPQMVMRLIG